jgi:hypothetical protein
MKSDKIPDPHSRDLSVQQPPELREVDLLQGDHNLQPHFQQKSPGDLLPGFQSLENEFRLLF